MWYYINMNLEECIKFHKINKEKSLDFVSYLYYLMDKYKFDSVSLYNKANISKQLFSSVISNKSKPSINFIIKIVLFGICMNFSFFIVEIILDLTSNISLAIRSLGENLFGKEICFSELITTINTNAAIDTNSLNIFSVDGLIKSTLSISLLSLVFSYSLRYIMIKVFVLLAPFAFISLSLDSTSWFFKSWIKNLFSLLFIQIIISLVLLILFSLDYSTTNLFNKFVYVGGIYALIRANTFVRQFIGGISTDISQSVKSLTNIKA